MIDIQGTGPLRQMIGIHPEKGIIELDIVCIRKNVTSQIEPILKRNHFFAMYSTPALNRNPAAIKHARFWCHCFKNPSEMLKVDKPLELISESDFIDPLFVLTNKALDKKSNLERTFDFFYCTINNESGFENKGLHEFVSTIDILCNKMKLRGKVLAYHPPRAMGWMVDFNKRELQILMKASDYLSYSFDWMNGDQLCKLMYNCKFGLFPNTIDCSPRLITESLIRNTPIMVNKNIWGGWKYVNENTGSLYDPSNIESIEKSASFILNSKTMKAKSTFLSEYGFQKSSKRLADCINKYIRNTGCTHMYFDRFGSVMKTVRRKIRKEEQ